MPIAPLVHHHIIIFLKETDHTHGEYYDEQYCALGMAKIAYLRGTGQV